MSLIDLLLILVVAGIAGAVAQAIVGYSRGGCLASIGLGFLGALLGSFLARSLGLPTLFVLNVGGTAFPLVWAVIGAALLVAVLSAVQRRRP